MGLKLKDRNVTYSELPSVVELANTLSISPGLIIKDYFLKGVVLNNNSTLSVEQLKETCVKYNYTVTKQQLNTSTSNYFYSGNIDKKLLKPRPPVVTIMGHVDHGKTTLIDKIRKSTMAAKEVGGITQHLGAYTIKYNNRFITMIDTPGHAAFSNIRTNGAAITDIIVLIIAADDGFKPQTHEAIKTAINSGAIIIVFINKIDKNNGDINKIYSQLSEYNLNPEEWGGETTVIKGSALTGLNVNQLLDSILLYADFFNINSYNEKEATGVILESSVEKGLGIVATVLVKKGALHIRDFLYTKNSYCNVKTMSSDVANSVKECLPGFVVRVSGFNNFPTPGDIFVVNNTPSFIKEKTKEIDDIIKKDSVKIAVSQTKSPNAINIIINNDTHNSMEAIKNTLFNMNEVNIVKNSIGTITEKDVMVAKDTSSIIIGFNVKPSKDVHEIAQRNNVKILFYNIIYKIEEDLDNIINKKGISTQEEVETGEATIQQIWKHSKVGTIAGCKVLDGEINRSDMARILRKGVVLFQTKINSLRHVKENINKAVKGTEFGITLTNFNDLAVGDIIQTYTLKNKK